VKALLNLFFQRLFKLSYSYEFFSQNACKTLLACLPRLTDAKFAGVWLPTVRKAFHFVYSRHANCKRMAASRMQTVQIAALILLTLQAAAAAIREPSTRQAASILCIIKIIMNKRHQCFASIPREIFVLYNINMY
jgi:hypothetical protein